MTIRRIKTIDNTLEEKILIGLIVSDKVCRDTIKLIKKNSFQNPYSQTIVKWIMTYYREYKKAPQQTIQDIYNVEKEKLKEDEVPMIAAFLDRLSDTFSKGEKLNEDFLIDRCREYFTTRALKNLVEKIDSCLELGKLTDAENALLDYRQVSKETTRVINPFSEEQIKKFYEDERNKANVMFKMPGAIGDLIGELERGTLVGVMAPSKRGKSFLLMELAVQAFFERYRVLYISLEMNEFKMERRFIRRITAYGDETKDYIYPCFDCFRNQIDMCKKSIRTNNIRLRNEKLEKPSIEDFSPTMSYKPCTVCRGNGKKDFSPETWFTEIRRPKRTFTNTKKVMKGILDMYTDNFKLICHPKFSANITDLKGDIERLEVDQDFIPDVIVVDYADILAPEDARVTGRDRIDETWKMFGNLADIRRALVITASQTNRASLKKKNVTQEDAAEDIRKIANVETMIVINQTDEEKKNLVARIAMVAGRDDEFDQYKSVLVLQNFALGQVCLDSEMIIKKPDIKPDMEDEEAA